MLNVLKRSETAWTVLGAVLAVSMYHAYSVPGAIGMFAAIGAAFLVWYRMSPRGAWIAVAIVGVTMASLLGWQAATGSRCDGGDLVTIKAGEMPSGVVTCSQLRASAMSMATFFGFIGLMGLLAPWYLRSRDDDEELDEEAGPEAPVTV